MNWRSRWGQTTAIAPTRALRAVLHALRDRLSAEGVAALGAQLPMLVRGIYYEGWHPSDKPLKGRREEFLAEIGAAFRDESDVDPESVIRAVLWLLSRHVTMGEIESVKHVLPTKLRSLWP